MDFNMAMKGYAKEIIWYSNKSPNGKYVIPISVDFDFTITSHSDWVSGKMYENDGCFDVMKKLQEKYNVGFILNTMRTGNNLKRAVDFVKNGGINLYGIGKNPLHEGEKDVSNKIFSLFDIDDKSVNAPLIYKEGMRPYINWKKVDEFLSPRLEIICKEITEMEDEVLKEKAECLKNSY